VGELNGRNLAKEFPDYNEKSRGWRDGSCVMSRKELVFCNLEKLLPDSDFLTSAAFFYIFRKMVWHFFLA